MTQILPSPRRLTLAIGTIAAVATLSSLWQAGASALMPMHQASSLQVDTTNAAAFAKPLDKAPTSIAFHTAAGETLFTRRINQITCRAVQGDREWLGTQLGVKIRDPKTGNWRCYTRRDGLPGDYVEDIAADAVGVFCIVRIGSIAGRIALCALDRGSDQWKTLQEANELWNNINGFGQSETEWIRMRGRSRLALNDRLLLFAPSTVGRQESVVLYALDRSTHVIHPVAWDPDLQADHSVLGISSLALAGDRAWLGSSVGLLAVDLGLSDGDSPLWQRYLPTRVIDAATMTADRKTLWMSVHDRPTGENGGSSVTSWNLLAVETASGKTTQTPPVKTVTATANAGSPLMFRRNDVPFPTDVSVDATGSVWVSNRTEGLYAYSPATNTWTTMTLAGDPPATVYRTPVDHLPGSDRVPDVAALPLALDQVLDERSLNLFDYGRSDTGLLDRPEVWVQARFPRWFSPETKLHDERTVNFVQDPAEPGQVWFAVQGALVHMAESDLPKWAAGNRTFSQDGQQSGPTAAWYAYQGTSLTVRPHTEALITDKDGLIVHTASGIYRLGGKDDKWTTLYRHKGQGMFDALNYQMARGGPDDLLLLHPDNADHIQYLDTARGTVVEGTALAPKGTTLIGASAQGAWFKQGNETVYFVPLAAKAESAGPMEKIDPTLPAALAPLHQKPFFDSVGATANTAWFVTGIRHRASDRYNSAADAQVVIGYDRIHHRLTTPLELDPFHGYTIVPFLGTDGATYIPRDDADASVYRYNAAADRWDSVAGALPTPAQLGDKRSRDLPTLIAAGKDGFCLTDWRYLYRYDRSRQSWSHVELPAPLSEHTSPFSIQWLTAATGRGFWIGSDSGLWCLDARTQIWEEKDFPLSLDPGSGVTEFGVENGLYLYVTAVDGHSVWGTLVPTSGEQESYFRFDRASHQFTVYGPASGVPVHEYATARSDGDGLWLTTQSRTYRLDARTGHAVQEFRDRPDGEAPSEVAAQSVLPLGSVRSVTQDPSDPAAAYVLLSGSNATLFPNDPQPAILYRFDKSSGTLIPMPISESVLNVLAKSGGDYSTHAPSIGGTGGLLARTGEDLWIGTTAGVMRVNRTTGIWRLEEMPLGTPRFLAYDIHPSPEGGVLIEGGSDTLQLDDNLHAPVAAKR